MNYRERMAPVLEMMKNNELEKAQIELLVMLDEEKIKNVSDEDNTHYTFNDYVEMVLFGHMYGFKKYNTYPEYNVGQIYYYLGYINIDLKNYEKAIEYFEKGLEWDPVNVDMMFEKAAAYRKMGKIERFKAEIEKIYNYIYTTFHMSKYYRELGWYYSEKRIFGVANALYTHSTNYFNTEIAINELKYIAQQENREIHFSSKEEIQKNLGDYNIPLGFYKMTVDIIFNEYQRIMKEKKNIENAKNLSRILYDITFDKQFMWFATLKDEELGIEISIPESWKFLSTEQYEKYGINPNTTFVFLTPQNQNINVICAGKCTQEQLDEVYKINIENTKKTGAKILKEYKIEKQNTINQVFVEIQKENKIIRIYENYLSVNGYLFIISWQVSNEIEIDKLYNIVNNSFGMDVVLSLRKLKDNVNVSSNGLKEYEIKPKDYPTFKFYFPEDLGEYVPSKYSNIFEIKKDGIQKIRVMIYKCNSEEDLENDTRKWIEKNKSENDMEEVAYRKEKIGNIPLEVYELKYINKPKLAHKIYKTGYINHYRITISGGLIKDKEKIINEAFKTIKCEESTIKTSHQTSNSQEINSSTEMEIDLKEAFINYQQGRLSETIKKLDMIIESLLKDDNTLQQDPFWKTLSCGVFKAIALNYFYNNKELKNNDLNELLKDKEKIRNNLSEFCNNFRGKQEINFIYLVEKISDKMLDSVIDIIRTNF